MFQRYYGLVGISCFYDVVTAFSEIAGDCMAGQNVVIYNTNGIAIYRFSHIRYSCWASPFTINLKAVSI